MLNKIAQILKVRWPEAVMLIGLFSGLSALGARMGQEFYNMDSLAARLPFWTAFVLGMALMALGIVLATLFLGFLRSAILDPLAARQPLDLLNLGRPYFWKLFLPYIVFNLVWTLLALVLMAGLHFVLFGRWPAEQIPDWLLRLSQWIALAVLIKPFLLMPGIVLLKNSEIPAAFVECRTMSLLRMKNLMKALPIGYALLLTVFGLLFSIPFPKPFFWIRIGLLSIVSGSVFLFFFLSAMLEIRQQAGMDPQETS